LRAFVGGTPFQLRVWRALLRVPAGTLTGYGQFTAAIDCPGAARAVGSAVGANPIAFIIPCHRVIRETGVLGNYRWDRIRKCAMIGWGNFRALAIAHRRTVPDSGQRCLTNRKACPERSRTDRQSQSREYCAVRDVRDAA